MLVQVLERYMPPAVHADRELTGNEPLFLSALIEAPDERINQLVADTFESQPYKMIANRFAAYPRTVGTRLKLFINILVENPAQVSLWVVIVQYLAWKRGVDMYTLEMFCEDFPNGVIYSDEKLSEIWKAQKTNGGFNMVDKLETQLELLERTGEHNESH
jgi:hypothetical protein